MDHALVVHEQQRPRLFHCETHSRRTVRVEHARLPATHIPALDQHQGNKIDSVSMGALGGWPADSVGSVDAKLMSFDVPAFHRMDSREDCADGLHQLIPYGSVQYFRRNRLKPALEASMESVVRGWLPMSAMGSQRQDIRFVDEARMST